MTNKQPYQMTSAEFTQSFPLFTELSPRAKWRLFRICNRVNLQETGEESTYAEFLEFANSELFRWDIEEATVLMESDHRYFVKEALHSGEEIPSDVLAEYPDLVEKHIQKRIQAKRLQQKRHERMMREKAESKMSQADKNFWSNF